MKLSTEYINFNKHILITGKSEYERENYLNEILLNSNIATIRFPRPLNSIEQYIKIIEKEKLFNASYPSRKKYNNNQLLDYHRDWISENKCLFVFEEIQEMQANWKIDLLKTFTNNLETNRKSATRLIITIENGNDLFLNLLQEITEVNNKSKKQIMESNFLILEM